MIVLSAYMKVKVAPALEVEVEAILAAKEFDSKDEAETVVAGAN